MYDRVHDRSLPVAMHSMENSDEIRVTMLQRCLLELPGDVFIKLWKN